MSIVLTRIDNRLIHGQVLESWVPTINANCIVVANDKIANSTMQKLLMEASVPKGIRVFIGSIDDAAEILDSEELANARIILLFKTSSDALSAHRKGVQYGKLNLGNMHAGDGKMKCSCTIALDPDDIENLNKLEGAGIRIFSQCVPTDKEIGWHKMVRITKS
jgi:PTS system mannose-specific IIB component